MSVYIEKETEMNMDFDVDSLIKDVVNECVDYENCPYEVSVMVTFTDNTGIRKLNREHRGIDKETDVLSFPMLEYNTPGDFSFIENNEEALFDSFDPDTGELVLGDIVISVEKAVAQAMEYGHSIKREIAFLCAHSMFHLFGYDHMEDSEREIMEEKQRKVLEKLEINR